MGQPMIRSSRSTHTRPTGKHIKYFLKYVKEKYPECTTLKKAKRYVNEWLQVRVDQDLSAWTIQAEAKALGKLYGIKPDDEDYFKPPKRNRSEIKRSRGDAKRDRHFSEANNDELIKFCRGTGAATQRVGRPEGNGSGDTGTDRSADHGARTDPRAAADAG